MVYTKSHTTTGQGATHPKRRSLTLRRAYNSASRLKDGVAGLIHSLQLISALDDNADTERIRSESSDYCASLELLCAIVEDMENGHAQQMFPLENRAVAAIRLNMDLLDT